MKYHIGFACNTAWNIYNFRRNLIRNLIKQGCRITTFTPPDDYSEKLVSLGCQVVNVRMDNQGTNPIKDSLLIRRFKLAYRSTQPDIVLQNTIKPVIYGSLAAHSINIPVINTITGLGTAFIRKGWLMKLVEILYRRSLQYSGKVFFQNPDDQNLFLERKLVDRNKTELIAGSGVDLDNFSCEPLPGNHTLVFLLIARMLKDKGIIEFITAARKLKKQYPKIRFQLLGESDVPNPTAIDKDLIDKWVSEGLVDYTDRVEDVRPFIRQADCIVLPSYREGSPRALMEAAAMGRPVIATDVTGCRDVVVDNVTGLLCHPRDATDLEDKMEKMITLTCDSREKMGLAGRKKMETEFDEKKVISICINTINQVLSAH